LQKSQFSLEKLATVFSLKLDDIKTEFFSDLFAKKIYENNCSMETLMVAEEKVNYLKSKNVKQGEIKFNTNE
jgi:HTH-type transcriptional regulator, competence development regulator